MKKWKQMTKKGYENYWISKKGKIWNDKIEKYLNQYLRNGYWCVKLKKINGKVKQATVSRLVAKLFVVRKKKKYNIVNHLDGDTDNNYYKNLEWTTQKKNVKHALDNNLTKTHPRAVNQLDLEGEFIKKHKSIEKIAEKLGVTRHAIIRVCVGKNKTCCGFKWEYSKPNDNYCEGENMKKIKDFKNYKVSDTGKVYSIKTKKFLKPIKNKNGQYYVTLCDENKKKKNHYIQQVVAQAFIKNKNNGKFVRHKDKDKSNNNKNNLEWY